MLPAPALPCVLPPSPCCALCAPIQPLVCPGCSHPAPGSPCTAQHLPAPLLGTQAQMGQNPAPAQWETSA